MQGRILSGESLIRLLGSSGSASSCLPIATKSQLFSAINLSPSSGSIRPTAITGMLIADLTVLASSLYWHLSHGKGPSVKPTPVPEDEIADT